ncbi:DUF6933 domain-containing protein [Paenibacillus silvisoli]|uniref:DUF6933 domain-containing protein n=1 Tax=Paenibacillus silvisoli TaxID=3110539 RepID=UPI002805EBC9|nr:hypothetical protein [Paenibacillus silvisoli]
MIALKFTKILIKDMKATPIEDGKVIPFYSWHVNLYKLNNRKHILFVNDLTRLCVIIDGVRSSQLKLLQEKFVSTLRTYLCSEGIDQAAIDDYLAQAWDITVTKTDNRSVLGTMKEISIFASDGFEDPIERMKWLNRLIFKPIEYQRPIHVFKDALLN